MKQVSDHKHLDLPLDSKLTFANHINEKLSKARRCVGVIKYLSSCVPVKTLDQINKIERVQHQAESAVTGTWKGTNKIYVELGWESLSDRRWFRRRLQFFKIQNGFTPEYLTTPAPVPRNHLFGSRSENDLHNIKCRTNSYLNSFYPHTVKIWNEIGPALRQAPSMRIFKANILKLIRPPKKNVFIIHHPKNTKRLFQLRVGLNPLRHHKNMKRLFQLRVDLNPLRHHKNMKRLFQLRVGLNPLRHHKNMKRLQANS